MNKLKNNRVFNEINISDKMKNNIYKACIKEKHTSNIAFRYSKQIAAACFILIFCTIGISAKAAVSYIQERMNNMSEEEIQEYVNIVDTSKEGDWYSRELTKDEHDRMQELMSKYREGRFPENKILNIKSLSELDRNELCYVEELGTIYIPEEELTDEQILEIIDYREKVDYSVNEASKDVVEEMKLEQMEKTKNMKSYGVVNIDEFNEATKKYVEEYLGIEVTDDSVYEVDHFNNTYLATYCINDVSIMIQCDDNEGFSYPEGKCAVDYKDVKGIGEEALLKYYDYDASNSYEYQIYVNKGIEASGYNEYFTAAFFSDELSSLISYINIDSETGQVISVRHGGSGRYYKAIPENEIKDNIKNYADAALEYIKKYNSDAGNMKEAYYWCTYLDDENAAEEVSLLFKMDNGCYNIELITYDKSLVYYTKLKNEETYNKFLDKKYWGNDYIPDDDFWKKIQ